MSLATRDIDHRFMSHALALGRRALGQVWPNPAVGCVIVRDGRIVGRGWTRQGGRPHAETVALAQAGDLAKGATAYVTLEPCAHHGRTPPCAAALIEAGISRVVAALSDPDPRVNGQGFEQLRKAGVTVETGVCEADALRDQRGFLTRVREGRPAITLKLASSFDGRIATATGESRWITGATARRSVHALRMCHDGVLVGGGTARADDPDLRVRGFGPKVAQPVRIVASRQLDLPKSGRLATSAGEGPVWLLHGARDLSPPELAEWEALGVRALPVAVGPGSRLDPGALARTLGDQGLTRILCEGGGALAASLLAADLVDEIVGFTAGVVLGAEGRPSLGALGVDTLSEAPRFNLIGVDVLGGDLCHRWERA